MRAAAVLFAAMMTAVLFGASYTYAQGPDPLEGRSLTTLGVPPGVGGAEVYTKPGQAEPGEEELPAEYYTQKVEVIQGVVSAVDPENRTITIMSGDAETLYRFDGLTRFQVKLKPICPTELKTGAKIAGLYREKDGSLYISRVVVITGEPAKKSKKSKKSRRSHRSKKRRRR